MSGQRRLPTSLFFEANFGYGRSRIPRGQFIFKFSSHDTLSEALK